MGCSGSKAEHLPLVVRCRERRDLIRAAANYQYKLFFSHISYFHSLKGVGDALHKYVDQVLLITVESSSSSPSADEGHFHDDDDDSQSHLADSSSEAHHLHDSDEDDIHEHHHFFDKGKKGGCFDDDVSHSWSNFHPRGGGGGGFNGNGMPNQPYSNSHHYPNPNHQEDPHMGHWGLQAAAAAAHYPKNTNVRCMEKGAPAAHTVIQEPPPEPSCGYSDSYFYPGAAGVGHSGNQEKELPPPPSPPKAPAWDFFNPFDKVNNNDYYSSGRHGYRSDSSSNGVREREGIPDLEEETESGKKGKIESRRHHHHSNYNSEGSGSRKFPLKNKGKVAMFNRESRSKRSEENVKTDKGADDAKKMVEESPSSPEVFEMENVAKREGVSFEASRQEGDPSKLSGVPPLSSPPCGNRDLKEAVAEIRDEFHTAVGYGKEVAVMLEVRKMPSFSKDILSQILYPISSSMQSAKLASKTMKLAKTYFDDVGKDEKAKACNLSSTLDKLYIWEKKLYKKVKEEEKHRIMLEKQRKRLECLERQGAEPSKIEAARASIQRLQKKHGDNKKTKGRISDSINELRVEELQPRVAALIHGLIRMWKAMFKCHQKQFKAVMESKIWRLKANTSLQTDPTSPATAELERELRAWCHRFNNWIASQKSYVESLNGWLLQCLQYELEVTPDGPVPSSTGHLGALPVSVICNDWHQQMNAVSEVQVENAMNTFAKTLRELWEKQDEEGRQRGKVEFLSELYENQLKQEQLERTGILGVSMVGPNNSGVSRKDDLKVDLESMWEKHRDAMNSVHEAAWSTLQGGLFPIFNALEVFTSEALKAHEHVGLQQPGLGS